MPLMNHVPTSAAGNGGQTKHDSSNNDGSWQIATVKGSQRKLLGYKSPAASTPFESKLTKGGQRKLRDSSNSNGSHHGKRHTNKYTKNNRRHGRDFPRVTNFAAFATFEQIDNLILAAVDVQHLPPGDMAAVWHRLSTLLVERRGQQKQQQRKPTDEFDTLFSRTLKALPQFDSIHLCQTALSMAKITKTVRNYRKGDCQELNHRLILHNLLIVKSAKQDIFQAIATATVPLWSQFEPQWYANLAYACAIAQVCPKFEDGTTLLGRIADAIGALNNLRSFKTQDLSNVLWSYATLHEPQAALFNRVADEVINRLATKISFEPQDVSNVVWAFARAKMTHRGLFAIVGQEIVKDKLALFNSQNITNIVWAFASAKEHNVSLFEKFANELVSPNRDLESFNPQNVSSIAWSFATAKVPHQLLFERIAEAAITRNDDPANILWAFSSSGVKSRLLFESMAPRVAALLRNCPSQELADIAWSYAVANVDCPILFNSAFTDVLLQHLDKFDSSCLRQLYQWHLWQKEEMHNRGLPPALEKRGYEAFVSNKVHVSVHNKDLMCALRSIGLAPIEKVTTPKGFMVDVCAELDGNKMGVRVDGPHHFIGRTPMGKTLLKRRQVANVEGIRLVSIPHWEWNQLGGDCLKQQHYLCEKLAMV